MLENDQERPCLHCMITELIDDFFAEVERVLGEQGIAMNVVEVEETRRSE